MTTYSSNKNLEKVCLNSWEDITLKAFNSNFLLLYSILGYPSTKYDIETMLTPI